MAKEIRNPKLIVRNGVFLFTRMLLVLFVSFYTARLTLDILGVEDFGINSVVGGLISTFAMVSMPLTSSLQRFYNVEFTKQQIPSRVVFSTSLSIIAILAIVMLVLYETIGTYVVNFILKYPESRVVAVNIVFQIAAFASIIHLFTLPYRGLIYSKEEMGVPAMVEIVTSLLKLGLLFVIPYLSYDNLVLYFILLFTLKAGEFVYYYCYCQKHYHEVKWTKDRDKGFRKSFLTYSGWNVIGTVSGISLTYMSNILINYFGGLIYNTAYGISKQVSTAVVSFTTNILRVIDPQITKSTSANLDHYRNQLTLTSIKITLSITGLLVIIFYFEGNLLLDIWLKDVPAHVYLFCLLALLDILFTSVTLPLRSIVFATGEIRPFFLFRGFSTAFIMIAMYILLQMHYPVISVMYLKVLSSMAVFAFTIYHVGNISSLKYKETLISIVLCLVCLFLFSTTYRYLSEYFHTGICTFIFNSIISLIVYLPLYYFVVLNQSERKTFLKIVRKR